MVTWGWLGRRGRWGSSSCQRKCLNWVLKEERPGKLVTKSNLSVASVHPSGCFPLRAQPVLPLKGGAAPRPPSHLPLGWGSRIEGKLSPAYHPTPPPAIPPNPQPLPQGTLLPTGGGGYGEQGAGPCVPPWGPAFPELALGRRPALLPLFPCPSLWSVPAGPGTVGPPFQEHSPLRIEMSMVGPTWGSPTHSSLSLMRTCGLGVAGGQGGQLQCIHSQQRSPRPGQAPAGSTRRSRRAEAAIWARAWVGRAGREEEDGGGKQGVERGHPC